MKTTLLCTALAAAWLPLAAAADTTCPAVQKFAPGTISTPDHWEWRLTFTPAQTRAYWATSVGWWPATRERSEIRTSAYHPQTGWQPAQLASFSGTYADFDPFVSPDGQTLFFSSMRPVNGAAKGDMDLWQVERGPNGWGTPTHIASPSLDGYDELYPSVDRAGNLYFARVKAPIPTEDVDIFVARRLSDGTYGPASRVVGGVDTPQRWEFNPEISPDGRTLLFVRLDLPDALPDLGYGFGDLYVSRLQDGLWSAATNLGPCVNTWNDEFHPTVLWEKGTLFFAKQLGSPNSDFYSTDLVLPD
jgi:hypothetical protein